MRAQAWKGGFVRGAPKVEFALRGIFQPAGGALAVLAPTARDVGLHVTAHGDTDAAFRRALKAGRDQGALAGRIFHGTGSIEAGKPMVVVAAIARSRQNALVAVQSMLNALKGVATRRDESKA